MRTRILPIVFSLLILSPRPSMEPQCKTRVVHEGGCTITLLLRWDRESSLPVDANPKI